MTLRKCVICNKDLFKKDLRIKCCSKECSKIYYKNYQKSYHKTDKYITYQKDYDKSENRQVSRNRCNKSEKRKQYLIKFRQSETWKKIKKRYENTKKGKIYLFNKWRRRRANKNNIIEIYTYQEWNQMKEAIKGICPCCKKFVGINNITLDHMYSIEKASKDYLNTGIKRIYTIDDIQPLCGKCNSSKSNKIIT